MSGNDERPHSSETPDNIVSPGWRRWMTFVLLAGIILPIGVYGFELLTRFCSFFFDPIPTGWHMGLLLSIPVGNALVLWTCYTRKTRYLTVIAAINGLAIGTGIVYSILFLPLLPFSIFAIILYGFGLLGLSPYLAIISAYICNLHLKELRPTVTRNDRIPTWGGVAVSLAVIVLYVVTCHITTIGLEMSASKDEAKNLRGIQMIRTFGNKTALLRACYDLPVDSWATGIFSENRAGNGNREMARMVYYRVTGESFNSVPPPRLFGPRSRTVQDWDFDSDVGGTAVNGVVHNLSLTSSRMDANIQPDALTGYTEWTMVFRNASADDREARAEIALPPGGVVSRLTLWVNGEEREAAFSSRGKVRQAYQKVAVAQRRDPVLVTTCGPDRVLLQCFPIRANGGTMKVRIGITSPLRPEGISKAIFTLPHFVERNFGISDGVKHSLLVDSPEGLAIGDAQAPIGSEHMVRAMIADQDIIEGKGTLICARNPITTVWTPDKINPDKYAIVQTLVKPKAVTPANVVIVVDGSKRLGDARGDIADALSALPRECRFMVIQAGDEVTELAPLSKATNGSIDAAADRVRGIHMVGGMDNRPALLKACDIALANNNTKIVWIHGPQPFSSDSDSEQLLQLFERRVGKLDLVAVAAANGRNSILAELESKGAVAVCPRVSSLSADIKRLFNSWQGGGQAGLVAVRKQVSLSEAEGMKTSSHIARLWARDEVERVCRLGDSSKFSEVSLLAAKHQIVTALSGAVVLETAEQYKSAGLKPVDPRGVPSTVPEPSTWLALAMGVAFIAISRRRMVSGHFSR